MPNTTFEDFKVLVRRAGLTLTDAQLALTQSQNVEAQALSDFRIALYRLDRALGRR